MKGSICVRGEGLCVMNEQWFDYIVLNTRLKQIQYMLGWLVIK